MEAAAITAANEGVGTGSQGREGEEALHGGKRVRGQLWNERELVA